MTSKHTPGPWKAREITGYGYPGQRGFAIDYNDDQEQVVDYVYTEADARLIAESPALLEALKLHVQWLKACLGCQSWGWDADQREAAEYSQREALALIARIEGES